MKLVVYHNRTLGRKKGASIEVTGCEVEHFVERPGGRWRALERAANRAKTLDCELLIPVVGNLVTSHMALKLLDGVKLRNPLDLATLIERAEKRNARTAEMVKITMRQSGRKYGSANPDRRESSEKSKRKFALAGARASSQARSIRANRHNEPLLFDMRRLQNEGLSYAKIAQWLNDQDLTTITGKPFTAKTVFNILKRMA